MLLFHEQFRAPILAGVKTVTRRTNLAWRQKSIKVGSIHRAYVRPPWLGGESFARLKILSLTVSNFLLVSEAEARREGFASVAQLRAYLREHGTTDLTGELARIEFEVVREPRRK